MPAYDPNTSIFAGVDPALLQTWLSAAQAAYIDVTTGGKTVQVSYGLGDSHRSVTFSRATLSNLVALIKQLQAQLGLVRHPRRALGVRF